MGLQCPKCGSDNLKVLDSRQSPTNPSFRRRRQCLDCEHIFNTFESLAPVIKVKGDDNKASFFDYPKLKNSVSNAFVPNGDGFALAFKTIEQEVKDDSVRRKIGVPITKSDIRNIVEKVLLKINYRAFLKYRIQHSSYPDLESFMDALNHDLPELSKYFLPFGDDDED